MTDSNDDITPEQEAELKTLLGDGDGNLKATCVWSHELLTSFIDAGFTREEAFGMVSKVTIDIMCTAAKAAMLQEMQEAMVRRMRGED